MNRERFDYICQEVEAGRDAFVTHPDSHEEGRVTECIDRTEHLVAKTQSGQKRCWDYRECEEVSRSSREWPRH